MYFFKKILSCMNRFSEHDSVTLLKPLNVSKSSTEFSKVDKSECLFHCFFGTMSLSWLTCG